MLYEFLCGAVPFAEEDEEPLEIYKKALAHNLVFPSWLDKNLAAKPFIEQLLNINPSMRNGGSPEKLKMNS